MRTLDNFSIPVTQRYVSWADRVFNPWLSRARSVGCSRGSAAGLIHEVEVGDVRSAISWNADAEAFAFAHGGRRQRVFAGPWCHALASDADVAERARFWSLLRRTPALDWMVLAGGALDNPAALPSDWGEGYDNVWVGAKMTGPESAGAALTQLGRIPAKLRFILATPVLDDLGELDLRGIGWVIIGAEAGAAAPSLDWVMSVKLQAMYCGIPTWMENPRCAGLAGLKSVPYAVQEHPRAALQR